MYEAIGGKNNNKNN